jgi:hypothetical protein
MVERNSDLEEIWNYDNRKLNSKSFFVQHTFLDLLNGGICFHVL